MWLVIHPELLIFNILRAIQNGNQFSDENFKCILFKENILIAIKISLKFVPKGPVNNISSDNGLVPARRQAIIWTNYGYFTDAYMPHSALMS